ncbi:MAG: multicopper oxidase domain-containing protein [Methylococcales bacterium]
MPIRFLLIISAIAIVFNCRANPDSNLRPLLSHDRLAREFEGSFAPNANPNGVIKQFELHAAPFDSGIRVPYRARVWGYNEQIPGPPLRIQLGDTLEVKLINELSQPTTIHWHGVRVPNAMDSVPDVTQKAVEAGESFSYRFTPKDAGTFWFHFHFNLPEQVG